MTTEDQTDDEKQHRESDTELSADGGEEAGPSTGGVTRTPASGGSGGVTDLILVAILTGLTAVAVAVPLTPQPLVWALGVPFVLFYPGYVWVVALFPEAAGRLDPSTVRPQGPPSLTARVALSLVASTIVVAAVAALLSPFAAIALGPAVLGITVATIAGALVAGVRRLRLPDHRRGGLSGAGGLPTVPLTGTRGANALTVVAFIALVAVVGAAVLVPPAGGSYSEAYLLTEDGDEFVADNLPETVAPEERAQFHVGLENHETGQLSYDVVTIVQERADGAVVDQRIADESTVTLAEGEQAVEPQEFAVDGSETDRRLQVLVYEGDRPDEPTAATADHVLGFSVTVDD